MSGGGVSLSPLNCRWMAASRLSHSLSWACASLCASSGLRVSHNSFRASSCCPASARLPSAEKQACRKQEKNVSLNLQYVKYYIFTHSFIFILSFNIFYLMLLYITVAFIFILHYFAALQHANNGKKKKCRYVSCQMSE